MEPYSFFCKAFLSEKNLIKYINLNPQGFYCKGNLISKKLFLYNLD